MAEMTMGHIHNSVFKPGAIDMLYEAGMTLWGALHFYC